MLEALNDIHDIRFNGKVKVFHSSFIDVIEHGIEVDVIN